MSARLQTKQDILSARPEDVETAYNGRDRICRCGCAGDYATPEENLRVVKLRLARVQNAIMRGDAVDEGTNYTNYSYGEDRATTIYLKAFQTARTVSNPQKPKECEPEAFAIMRGEL